MIGLESVSGLNEAPVDFTEESSVALEGIALDGVVNPSKDDLRILLDHRL